MHGTTSLKKGKFLPTFWDNLSIPSEGVKKDFLALDDGTDGLSRNVGRDLHAAKQPRRARVSVSKLLLI